MRLLVGRLLVTALLFGGWIAYLGYLVATRPLTPEGRPLVLSRSQLLVSDLDVVAQVDDPGLPVKVEEVLYPPEEEQKLKGQVLKVINLDDCHPLPLPAQHQGPGEPPDWTGPGRYLLPLRHSAEAKEAYEVAPTPPTAGYPPRGVQGLLGPPRIYFATNQALAQYHQVPKPH